mgnify:CR=1 FL=1
MRFEAFARDVMAAVRVLLRNRMATTIGVATIAIALGLNLPIYSVVNALILQPLPFPDDSRLVFIQNASSTADTLPISWREATSIASSTQAIDGAAYSRYVNGVLLGAQANAVTGYVVSPGYFRLLGMRPLLGALPKGTAANEAVISEALWRSRFNGDPAIIGRTLPLDGGAVPIVAVLPAGVVDPVPHGISTDADYWLVESAPPLGGSRYVMIAHLAPGASVQGLNTDLRRIASNWPGSRAQREPIFPYSIGLRSSIVGSDESLILFSLVAVLLVFIVACANISTIQLASSIARMEEWRLRAVLGASAARITVVLILESVIVSLAGGVVGIAISALVLRTLILLPGMNPFFATSPFDFHVLLYFLGMLGIGAVIIALPTVVMVTGSLVGTSTNTSRSGISRLSTRLREVLVVAEIGVAIVLAATAVLLANNLQSELNLNLGFSPQNLYDVRVTLVSDRYSTALLRDRFVQNGISGLKAAFHTNAVASTSNLPLDPAYYTSDFRVLGQGVRNNALFDAVSPGYFSTMQVPVLSGRDFADTDRPGSLRVAIVNQSFVNHVLSRLQPIGTRIFEAQADGTWTERVVVGVVGDMRYSLDGTTSPVIYVPMSQEPRLRQFVIRTSERSVAPVALRVLTQLDPNLPSPTITALAEIRNNRLLGIQTSVALVTVLSAVGILLALTGIYGLTAFNVEQRTHEIGIRVALGATRSAIARLIIRRSALVALLGLALGLLLCPLALFILEDTFGSLTGGSALYVVAVAIAVLAITIAACIGPIRKATSIPPATALRYE